MMLSKRFWIRLSLINLCLVALLGFALRSKILFPIENIDFRRFLSAHSHFAFSGWVGLALISLFIFDLLPSEMSNQRKYGFILWGIEISSLGMAFSFPFFGYAFVSVFFSSSFIFVFLIFAWLFINDICRIKIDRNVKLLSISAIVAAIISFLGPLGLVYILISRSGNSILYRDSIYTFLHFQYNGFFTLSVFALFVNKIIGSETRIHKIAKNFSVLLCLYVLPTLFLALLWHNRISFYVVAIVGCLLIVATLFYFSKLIRSIDLRNAFPAGVSRTLLRLSFFSFTVKMLLQIGTIFPQLGNAVYGDRPVIIGFLHLVFLGFVTFYILATLRQNGYFGSQRRNGDYPLLIFSIGIILNEILLMTQGLGILFRTNNGIYSWLLWIAASILVIGAVTLATTASVKLNKGADEFKTV